MPAGRMRERVAFERRSDLSHGQGAGHGQPFANDGYGNRIGGWQVLTGLSSYPARISPLRGGEDVIAEKLQGTGLVEIKVRSCVAMRAVKPTDRVRDTRTDQIYNIRYIENKDERDKYVTLTCEYGVADG